MNENFQKKITALLNQKSAPQGKIEGDFRVALYVVAALFQIDFSNISNLGMCSNFLGKVGFKGDISQYKAKDYFDTVDDLVTKGALVKLFESSKVYAAPCDVKIIESKVKAVEDVNLRFEEERYYNYVIEDETGKEYRLNTKLVLLPNDEVEAVLAVNCDVAFVKRITKVRQCVLGRIMLFGKSKANLMPDEPNLKSLDFTFANSADLGEAKSGDIVIAEITRRNNNSSFSVKTREVVKDIGNLNNIIVMSVLRNDIPNVWPDNLIKSLSRIPTTVKPEEAKGRVDLRQIPLVTIDGEDARDFDDAVYCKKEGKGWRLFVSIADVSYYVKTNTLLDKEAVNRCNSCYFPNFVIPMLPDKLSNGICSLNPDVDRLCMTCEMEISKQGKIEGYRFYPAIMRSHARLTYNEAWKMICEGKSEFKEHDNVIDDVKELFNLYQAFKKDRINRGGISVESEELHFVFNENMEIEGVKPLERNDSHKLIEECMIAANVCAACFVNDNKYQTLYRVHAKPMEKKLGLLMTQLARFGLSLKGGESPTSKDYMNLADSIANRQDAKIINELILRSMSKAEYTPDNIGHFGLALDKYAHFTSPIRRYADLQLHRVIKYILEKQEKRSWGKIGARAYTKAELVALGVKCTAREIAAATAEREVDASLACVYMEKFIGESVQGTVTGCTNFGVFVRLDDYGVDGMIYVGDFDTYMNFNEKDQSLTSNYGDVYTIGKKIKVIVSGVNHEELKINLLPDDKAHERVKKSLKTERDSIIAKRAKISKSSPKKDKEKILKDLSDISSSRVAKEEDNVDRSFAKKKVKCCDWQKDPYGAGAAVNMPQIFKGKKSKKKSRKGR